MWKNFTLISALATLSLIPQTIQGIPFKVFENDHLDASVDALLVQRKGIRKKTLALDLSKASPCNCKDGTVITSTELMNRFRWEPGVKGTICYTPSVLRSVEFSVAWVAEWHASLVRCGDNTMRFPFTTTDYTQDYNFAWRAKATYASQLWDFEGNYWRHITPRGENYYSVSAIAGLRGIYLGEHSRLQYTTPPDTSDFSAHSKNRLFGFQGGLCIQMNPGAHDLWSFELIPKVGLLTNWINASSWLGDVNNTVVVRTTEKTKIRESYLLDGDLRLSYHPRHGLAHIGYRMIGIWNVSLAPNQLSRHIEYDKASEVRNWRAFYHIIYLGFDWVF
jgi:hypothetical protein